MDRPKNTRDPPTSYRPPAHLRAAFNERVVASGLSVNAFITKAIFDDRPDRASRRPTVSKELLARLLIEAARIRDCLDEAGAGRGGLDAEAIAEALRDLTEIRAALLRAMGRQP